MRQARSRGQWLGACLLGEFGDGATGPALAGRPLPPLPARACTSEPFWGALDADTHSVHTSKGVNTPDTFTSPADWHRHEMLLSCLSCDSWRAVCQTRWGLQTHPLCCLCADEPAPSSGFAGVPCCSPSAVEPSPGSPAWALSASPLPLGDSEAPLTL